MNDIDTPKVPQVNCFGEDSLVYAEDIKKLINDKVRDSYYYQYLSLKAPHNAAHALRRISQDERNHARRLSSALYLITGERYFPANPRLKPSNIPLYRIALRERFRSETIEKKEYNEFARKVKDDNCLKRLALETAKSEEEHASVLYRLLREER